MMAQTGLEPPVVPRTFQIASNKTVGHMYCPWRPFPYICQLVSPRFGASLQSPSCGTLAHVCVCRCLDVDAGQAVVPVDRDHHHGQQRLELWR